MESSWGEPYSVPEDEKGLCRGYNTQSHVTQSSYKSVYLLTTHLICELFEIVVLFKNFKCWQEYTQRVPQAFLNIANKQKKMQEKNLSRPIFAEKFEENVCKMKMASDSHTLTFGGVGFAHF